MHGFRQYGHYYGAQRVARAAQVVHQHGVPVHRDAAVEVRVVELEHQRVAALHGNAHIKKRVAAHLHRRDYATALFQLLLAARQCERGHERERKEHECYSSHLITLF